MTGILEPLEGRVLGIEVAQAQASVFRWGVVTQVSPLRIILPGDASPVGIDVDSLTGPLELGDRVRVETKNSIHIVHGAAGGTGGGSTLVGVPVGSIMLWMTDTAPDGWLFLRGQAVSRTTYADLFALWGTSFGSGNGSTTFNVDDWRGRAPVGKSTDPEFDTLGKKHGTKTHTLTTAEMPAHNHGPDAGTSFLRNGSGTNANLSTGGGSYALGTATANAGSGGAHNNIQPSVTVNWIVRAL